MDVGCHSVSENRGEHGEQVFDVASCFETLGCIRVEFKTDSLNDRSRQALLRIGAKEEGILRNHMIVHDGRYRHSVSFSVIDSEWPDIKATLQKKLLV